MVEQDAKELELNKSGVKRISQRHSERITDDAVRRVMFHEEKRMEDLFSDAKKLANHRGRETITEDDVLLALQLKGEL